jgi:glutathione peroxidase
MSLRDIPLTTISGSTTTLAEHQDKVVLVVNVASKCGLTPQYDALEAMYRKYRDRGFVVLGFPSNQFFQEPGEGKAIEETCRINHGVTFPLFQKTQVNGRNAHPLYQELTKTPDAAGKAGKVKWNFEKFVVTPDDEVYRFRPTTVPDAPEVLSVIEGALRAAKN